MGWGTTGLEHEACGNCNLQGKGASEQAVEWKGKEACMYVCKKWHMGSTARSTTRKPRLSLLHDIPRSKRSYKNPRNEEKAKGTKGKREKMKLPVLIMRRGPDSNRRSRRNKISSLAH